MQTDGVLPAGTGSDLGCLQNLLWLGLGEVGGCHPIYCKHADATINIFPALKSEHEFVWFCLAADGMLNTVIIQR